MKLRERIDKVVERIRSVSDIEPQAAIILGTGLGGITERLKDAGDIGYDQLPAMPNSTVVGHAGRLMLGELADRPVVVWDGRFHYYEGHSLEDITLPVRVSRALGAGTLIVSNAAGGLNHNYNKGDIVIIEDHINLMGVNPLIGPNDETLGSRFPDMCEPYTKRLVHLAEKIALDENIRAHRGVYAAMTGPCLETRAEYRMLRMIGADMIGMSTIPEVITAVHAGMEVLGLSCVTDLCLADALKPVDISEIIAVANAAEPKLTTLVERTVREM